MKKQALIILTIFLLIISSINVYAGEENNIEIMYFGTDRCITCYETSKIIEKTIEDFNQKGINISIKKHDISNTDDEDLFLKYSTNYNISPDKFKVIPAIFIGDVAFVGKEEIVEELESILSYYVNNPDKYVVKQLKDESFNIKDINLGFFAVVLGGLLDGINPCSISMMLFFISFALLNQKRGNILLIGLFFCLGTFVAYYGIGIGILKFVYTIDSIKILGIVFYGLLVAMSIYLAILNIKDYVSIKKGNYGDIKNQLSSNSKKRIHNFIKKKATGKVLYLSAFLSAFVISFFEFFCTGQIYLPMITYMIRLNINSMGNYILLAIYNLAFILPLVVITIVIHYGKEVIDISQVLLNKLNLVKLMGAIFFIFVAISMSLQLIKLF